jgi:hypothetical protein
MAAGKKEIDGSDEMVGLDGPGRGVESLGIVD